MFVYFLSFESESESRSVMSDSLQPHGLYSLWNSPGQITGVGSLSLFRWSSQPRDQTQVPYIAGRFFTSWAIFSSVQSLSHVRLFVTPWTAACQASLSITNSRSSLKLMSIESVMPSSHLILCRPLLLLPPIPPRIRVFSNESTLHMRWPKYWSFSFSISPSKEHPYYNFCCCSKRKMMCWIIGTKIHKL